MNHVTQKSKTKELLLGETCKTCANYDARTKRCYKYGPWISEDGAPLPIKRHCPSWVSAAKRDK